MQRTSACHRASLRALHELWRSRLGPDAVPRRSAFVPEDFKPWMGNVIVVGVEGAPPRFRLRLVGTTVVDYEGADYTGRYIDEVLVGAVRDVVVAQHEECARTGRPMAFSYRAPTYGGRDDQRGEVGVDKLFLPVSLDGRTVRYIYTALYATFFIDGQHHDRPQLRGLEGEGSTLQIPPDRL